MLTPIQIRPNRYLNLVMVPFILALMYVFYYQFQKTGEEAMDTTFKAVSVFIWLVGALLIFASIRTFIKNPVLFQLDDKGIEATESGNSTGLISWDDVKAVEEKLVSDSDGRAIKVLILSLTAHTKDLQTFNRLVMGALFTPEPHAVYIPASFIGKQYDEVKNAIGQKLTASEIWRNAQENTAAHASTSVDAAFEKPSNPVTKYIGWLKTKNGRPGWLVYIIMILSFAAFVHDGILNQPLGFPFFAILVALIIVIIAILVFSVARHPKDQ